MRIPIVSATTIREICGEINASITDIQINNACINVQNSLLKETLTEDFYYHILGQITGGTVQPEIQFLIDEYLAEILALGIWKYLNLTLSLPLYPSGVVKRLSDESDSAELKDIGVMNSLIDGLIDSKRKEMQRYLIDQQSLHPDWYILYWIDRWGDKPNINTFIIDSV